MENDADGDQNIAGGRAAFPLLSEDEAAALLEAEWQAGADDLDEGTRQRLWRRIEVTLPPPLVAGPSALARRWRALQWSAPLALASGMVLVLGVYVVRAPPTGASRVKGVDTGAAVTLMAYTMQGDGSLLPFGATGARVGDTLVFKTQAAQNGVVALVMAGGREPPVVRFVGTETRAGAEQLLEQGGRTYGYRLDAREHLRFCALVEASSERLSALTARLPEIFHQLGGAACVDIAALESKG